MFRPQPGLGGARTRLPRRYHPPAHRDAPATRLDRGGAIGGQYLPRRLGRTSHILRADRTGSALPPEPRRPDRTGRPSPPAAHRRFDSGATHSGAGMPPAGPFESFHPTHPRSVSAHIRPYPEFSLDSEHRTGFLGRICRISVSLRLFRPESHRKSRHDTFIDICATLLRAPIRICRSPGSTERATPRTGHRTQARIVRNVRQRKGARR